MDREAFQKARGRAIRNHWTRTNARPATAFIDPRSHRSSILSRSLQVGVSSGEWSDEGAPTGFQDNAGMMRRCGDSFLLRFGMAVRGKEPSKKPSKSPP